MLLAMYTIFNRGILLLFPLITTDLEALRKIYTIKIEKNM
jgi:hypothetical protein